MKPSQQEPAPTPAIITMTLSGHLTVLQLKERFANEARRIRETPGRTHIIYDCRTMTGYDKEARSVFVEWHRDNAEHIGKVAIITLNTVWIVVIAAMALATGRSMRSFATIGLAERWLLGTDS